MSEPPDRFVCPITQEVMRFPVMDRDGHNFEKEAIEAWLQRHDDCPMGREPLTLDGLFPNRALREEITEAMAKESIDAPSAPPPPVEPPRAVHVDPSRPWEQYGISQEEYDHVLCQFITFDEDSSGKLDRKECQRLCRFLNYPNRDIDINRMFEAAGAKEDGKLDLHEFMSYMQNKRPKPELLYGMSKREYEQFMMQFSSYDHDGDGLLNREDLRQLCIAQGYPHSPEVLDRLFECLDANRSQLIDAHEFLMFMRYNDPRKLRTTAVPARYASPTHPQPPPPAPAPAPQPPQHSAAPSDQPARPSWKNCPTPNAPSSQQDQTYPPPVPSQSHSQPPPTHPYPQDPSYPPPPHYSGSQPGSPYPAPSSQYPPPQPSQQYPPPAPYPPQGQYWNSQHYPPPQSQYPPPPSQYPPAPPGPPYPYPPPQQSQQYPPPNNPPYPPQQSYYPPYPGPPYPPQQPPPNYPPPNQQSSSASYYNPQNNPNADAGQGPLYPSLERPHSAPPAQGTPNFASAQPPPGPMYPPPQQGQPYPPYASQSQPPPSSMYPPPP